MSNFNIDINNFLRLENFSHKKFLIFGEEPALIVKAKNHALADEDLRMVEKVYLDMEERDFEENFNQAILSNSLFNEKKVVFIKLKKNRLNKELIASFKLISEANTESLILIETQSISKKIILKDTGVTLVLDQIQDPCNFCTIIRICDWFGVKQIICSNDTVDMYNSKVVQSSMGSIFRVNIFYKNLVEYLKNVNNPVYATLKNGNSIKKIKKNKNCHIIIGNESRGISNNLFSYVDEKFSINQTSSDVDSLNVAVATGIILYDFCA